MVNTLMVLSVLAGFYPANDAPKKVDPERLKLAVVVLRVKLDRPLGGETGLFWYKVNVLEIIKNDSKQKIGTSLDVATYVKNFGPKNKSVPGVPAEECTIYLEPLRNSDHRALLGGQAEQDVSHVEKKK